MPADSATHWLLYVFLSHPQTGLSSLLQIFGFAVQEPLPPQGPLQNCETPHAFVSPTLQLPEAPPHLPSLATLTPLAFAVQELL